MLYEIFSGNHVFKNINISRLIPQFLKDEMKVNNKKFFELNDYLSLDNPKL